MCQYFNDVTVVVTGIAFCCAILRYCRSLCQQQDDNQGVGRQTEEGEEQQEKDDTDDRDSDNAERQSSGEEQQEKDDSDDDHDSNNAERQSSDAQLELARPITTVTSSQAKDTRRTDIGTITTASDYLKEKCRYYFKDGKLVDTESGKGFIFKGQQDYEKLGEVMDEYIYELLERDGELERRMLGTYGGTPRGFCFASKDVDTNANGMLVLIHGTGVVRAGQWSRRLIINHSIESGSQMPYIQEAKKRNWSVVVMNTNQRNDRYKWMNGQTNFMGYDPEEHGVVVWKTIVERSPAKHIAIVAHSYGGSVTSCLLREMGGHFKEKVVAIALTDSWCSVQSSDQQYFKKVAKNWVTSKYPVGHSVGYGYDCEHVSAGTTVHEETSWKSMENVFEFIGKKFQGPQSSAKTDVDSTSQDAQKIEKVEQLVYQQDARDDLNAQVRNETKAGIAPDTPLASPPGSSEDSAISMAANPATDDGNTSSTTNCADKNGLDNFDDGSLPPVIVVPEPGACEQQHGAFVEGPNPLTSTVTAVEHGTAVTRKIEKVEQPVYQQEAHDDLNAQVGNETKAGKAADTPLASTSDNSEDTTIVMVPDPATDDSNIPSTTNCANKNELHNFEECSLPPAIVVSDPDACEQQRGAFVEGPNPLTSTVAAVEHGTAVARHATEIGDTSPFLSEMTKENRDAVVETHRSVAYSTAGHPVGNVSLEQNERENPKFDLPAAPEDNERKSEVAEPFDRNFVRRSVISDSNVSASGSSDQSLVYQTAHPLSAATVSTLPQPSPLPFLESQLKQSLTVADGAGIPATANNTPTSVMATAELIDGLPERTIEQLGTELAPAEESSTDQGSYSQHAADTVLEQTVTEQSDGKAERETVNDDPKV